MRHILTQDGRTPRLLLVLLLALGAPALADDDKAFVRQYQSENLEWNPCPAFMPDSCGLAVLQGDPGEPNADVFFRLRAGTTAPHHWHNSAERMVLVAGKMSVDYDGQEPVVMHPGDYAYGPPELPHVAHCESDQDCVLFIAFEKPVDAFAVEQ